MTERCKWNPVLSFCPLRAFSKFDGSKIELESSSNELQRSFIELESSQTE